MPMHCTGIPQKFSWESSSFKPWLSMLNACLKRPHISLFQGEGIHDLFLKSYVFWHLPLSYCLIHTPESVLPVFSCLPDNSPLWKREGTWNQNSSHNILFLGSLLGTCSSAIGQFFFPVPSDSPRSLCEKKRNEFTWHGSHLISKAANGVLSDEWLQM